MAEHKWLLGKMWNSLKLRHAQMNSERFARIKPEQWARMQSASRRGRNTSLRSRRRLVVCYIFLLSFYLPLAGWDAWAHASRIRPWDGSLWVPYAFFIAWIAWRDMRRRLPTSTLDEYCVLNYGSDFLALEESRRVIAYLEYHRDEGRKLQDEHETGSRLRSQATAYRILSPMLVLGVAALWAVNHFWPMAQQQAVLRMTADVAIWLASVALVAPMMIRMWSEPDNPGEPSLIAPGQVVPAQKEA
jgi:hypothetical protein